MSEHLLGLLQVLYLELVLVQLSLLLLQAFLHLPFGLLKLPDPHELVTVQDFLQLPLLGFRLLSHFDERVTLLLDPPLLPLDCLYIILERGDDFLELLPLSLVELSEPTQLLLLLGVCLHEFLLELRLQPVTRPLLVLVLLLDLGQVHSEF